jgi:hypothetical protein
MFKEDKKLSPEDKKSIVRDFMLKFPDTKVYGYKTTIQKHFKEKHKTDISIGGVCRIIDRIEEEFSKVKSVLVSKTKLISQYQMLLHQALNVKKGQKPNVDSAIKILREIGKLEGHYIERIKSDVFNFDIDRDLLKPEDEERLNKEMGIIFKNQENKDGTGDKKKKQ